MTASGGRVGPLPGYLVAPAVVLVLLTGVTVGAAVVSVGSPDIGGYFTPMDVFGWAMGSTGLQLGYPVLVVAVYLLGFTERLRARWIFYARPRIDIRGYLARAAVQNAVAAFTVFFLFAFVCGLVIFYLIPASGVVFPPLYPGYPTDAEFARMTELTAVSDFLYVVAYALWTGVNAAVWATFGFVAVLVFRNRVVALATPFSLFVVLAVVMGLAPFEVIQQNAPWLLWMLFSIGQVSMIPAVLILAVFAVVAAGLAWWAVARPGWWETLA